MNILSIADHSAGNPIAQMFSTGRTGLEDQTGSTPLKTTEEEDISAMLHAVMGQLAPRRPVPDSESNVRRPGSYYARYRDESEMPELTRSFYSIVADVAGIPLDVLIKVVLQTEFKIGRWQEDKRRREHHGLDTRMEVKAPVEAPVEAPDA